jgi:hypothetical protein
MRPVKRFADGRMISKSKVADRSRCGKQAYSSRKIAKQRAAFSSKMTGEKIEAYKCRNGCHAWHLGHPPGSREAAA